MDSSREAVTGLMEATTEAAEDLVELAEVGAAASTISMVLAAGGPHIINQPNQMKCGNVHNLVD
jgi:hypothetical protein